MYVLYLTVYSQDRSFTWFVLLPCVAAIWIIALRQCRHDTSARWLLAGLNLLVIGSWWSVRVIQRLAEGGNDDHGGSSLGSVWLHPFVVRCLCHAFACPLLAMSTPSSISLTLFETDDQQKEDNPSNSKPAPTSDKKAGGRKKGALRKQKTK
jgi:hypothetical protein